MNIENRQIIVTGGGRGLGYILVKSLLNQGASIAVFDFNDDLLNALKKAHPKLETYCCDITNPGQVDVALEKYAEKHRSPDILINNAGMLYNCPLAGIGPKGLKKHTWDDWRRVLAANLDSVFLMTAGVVERMIKNRIKGLIVNISSVSAAGNAGQSAYSAAKAGVNALTATWAKELGPMGIRVAGIAPGFIETESTSTVMSPVALQEVLKHVPIKRLGQPIEIAKAVLAVIDNDFFHGKVLPVDGGLVL